MQTDATTTFGAFLEARYPRFADYLHEAERKHGDRFSPGSLAPQFIPYFETTTRLRVRTTYPGGQTWERTGTVGVTTGWVPSFLLMSRSNARGSSDLLRHDDAIVAIKPEGSRTYQSVDGS